MNEGDLAKIDFIRVNLQVDNLISIIKLISRPQLVKTIEMVPKEQREDFNYKVLRHTLSFLDSVEHDYINSIADGPINVE